MTYFRFHVDRDARRAGRNLAVMGEQPDLKVSWRMGARFALDLSGPIACRLSPRGGPDLPDVFLTARIPVFSERLLGALAAAGVDNLDTYPVEIIAEGAAPLTAYRAVNIVGKIRAVNEALSDWDPASDYPMMEFRKIVLDESRIRGPLLFRLAENPSFILVAESVKSVLDRTTWTGLRLYSLDDPAAY